MRPIEFITLGVFMCLALSLLAFHRELSWAASELPKQLQGEISTPRDRLLTLEAKELMASAQDIPRAEKLLLESLALEPHSEALLYLAMCRLQLGKLAQAQKDFQKAQRFDPDRREVYLGQAELYRRREQHAKAVAVLERGIQHFKDARSLYEPQIDPSAQTRANDKAQQTYRYYRNSAIALGRALKDLKKNSEGL